MSGPMHVAYPNSSPSLGLLPCLTCLFKGWRREGTVGPQGSLEFLPPPWRAAA